MAVNLSPIWGAGAQLLDNSGNVLSGGKIYTYAAGTTTQVATYTSNSGVTANSNPIVLNSAGRVPYEIWLTDGQNYKFVLKDSNDVLIGTWDNLSGINSNFVAYTNQQEIQTATAGQTVFNLTTMQYLPGTGNLSVFVDGVNQYGPGAQYAYEETDSTTVTFASGLHVGASVKFTSTQIENAGVADASQISYTYPATGAFTTNVEDKLAQYVSVKDFGAVGDGVTDDTAAFNAALAASSCIYFPTGKYRFDSKITFNLPVPAVGSQDTNAIATVKIYGDGADNSILYWPDSDGIQFNFSSQQHSVHLSDFTMTTGGEAVGDAITFTNSYAFFGTWVAQSDITGVTFRGDDGYANVYHWNKCVAIANVSDINFDNVNFYGESDGTQGTGVYIASPGAGCFASGSLCTCGTVYNFTNCNFTFLGTGFVYGDNTQTVQFSNCFFAQCETGIYSPLVTPNTLQGLLIENTTFFCFGESVNIQSDLPNVLISNCMFTVNDSKRAIFISPSNNFTIIGNQFIPYGSPNTQVAGIEIASTTAGSIGVIDGNTFSSVNKGVLLGASSSGVKVGIGNSYTGMTDNVVNTGTNNIVDLTYTTSGLRSISPTNGLGYGTGAGGSVTQGSGSGKATTVVLNKVCGKITTNNATLNAGDEVAFTVTDSTVTQTDVILSNVENGNYGIRATDIANGSFVLRLKNVSGGNLSDAVLIRFAVIRSADA